MLVCTRHLEKKSSAHKKFITPVSSSEARSECDKGGMQSVCRGETNVSEVELHMKTVSLSIFGPDTVGLTFRQEKRL